MAAGSPIDLDLDAREAAIRKRIYDAADFWATPEEVSDALVATYFLQKRDGSLHKAGQAISYYMTTGVRHPPAGTLIEQCTGKVEGVLPWDASGRVGLVRVSFPLKLFQHGDGKYYTTDFLHVMGGEGIFGLWEFGEAKLVDVKIPGAVIATFPGPAYGCQGLRVLTNWPEAEPAFGTILKPTAGITDDDVARFVEAVAGKPLFMLVKEDENLLPDLDYCPVVKRARKAQAAVCRAMDLRGNRGLIYAPHITSPPQQLLEIVMRVLETGVKGLMFSEQYTGGSVRAVRELTSSLASPPVIYGHNGGISSRTNCIWREVLDLFVRLDGVDFRQTAPVATGEPLLRPQGLEWRQCEAVLSRPLGPIKPVMIARAGGLDQGNIIPNLLDAAQTLPKGQVLYLAGSAIHSLKGANGKEDRTLGVRAMEEAVALWRGGEVPVDLSDLGGHVRTLYGVAQAKGLKALVAALQQRYGVS